MEDYRKKYSLLFEDDSDTVRKKRYQQAISAAQKIADILKKDYHAEEVRLFGSLLDFGRFFLSSDIDIAERGIPREVFYSAYAKITREIRDFKIDLVDMEDCREYMKKAIESGKIL